MSGTNQGESHMDAGGAYGAKLGIEVLKRTAPSAIAWVSTYVRGVTLLMVGPSAAGKTSFADYLIMGRLDPETHHMTTVEETISPTFSIDVGKNSMYKLRVRRAYDEPGQVGPMAHANLVKTNKPHALIVLLDINGSVSENKKWISEFSINLERVFNENPKCRKRLKSVVVCMNKRDKLKSMRILVSRTKAIQKALIESLATTLGAQRVQQIPILPCVSVLTKEYGSTLIDAIIARLAKDAGSK